MKDERNSMIRAVIFDVGGVLVRTVDPSGREKWEERLGLTPKGMLARVVFESEASDRAALGQGTEEQVWRYVGQRFGLSPLELEELIRDFWGGDRLDTDLVGFIRELRKLCKIGILSNAWPGARRNIAERWGLGQVADTIVVSAEEGLVKPDPRIYEIAAQRLDVQPQETVFVDDTMVNVQGAQAIGMHGVQFKTTAQTIAEIRNIFDHRPIS